MENKTKEELVELVAAQTKVIDRLTLKLATRQPLADSFVAPSVAIELTPLFAEKLDRIARSYFSESYGQEQVKHAIHDAFIELRASQPVVGELPPLPETRYNGCGDGSEPLYTPDMMQAYVLADRAQRAAQPVQQPAAVVGQDSAEALAKLYSDVRASVAHMGGIGSIPIMKIVKAMHEYNASTAVSVDECQLVPLQMTAHMLGAMQHNGDCGGNPDRMQEKWAATLRAAPVITAPVPAAGVQAFQQRVQPWMMACFGAEISADKAERNHRFFEESTELVQSLGMTASEAHQLVDYVFGRDIGEPPQEVGGVMVTLAALCLANKLDMHEAGEVELARIWTKVEAIRAKQAAKPKHSPLPQAATMQPESGRDAAQVVTDIKDQQFREWCSRNGMWAVAKELKAYNEAIDIGRAIAAHPAPSSDAAILADKPDSDFRKCLRSFAMRVAEEGIKEGSGRMQSVSADRCRFVADGVMGWELGKGLIYDLLSAASLDIAAHPANGAQAGLSDALGDVIKGEIRSAYNEGYGHGKADGDKTASRFIPGNVVAECWTAILAAAKKG